MSGGINFYRLRLPDKVEFTPAEFIARVASARVPFRFMLEKSGLSGLEVVVSSDIEMKDILEHAVASSEYNCEVTELDVFRSDNYPTGTVLRKPDAVALLRIADVVQSTFLSLRGHEKLRLTVDVVPAFSLLARKRARHEAYIAFTILFSGSPERLRSLFPPAMERKFFRIHKSWKVKPLYMRCDLGFIDSLIPLFDDLPERDTRIGRRHAAATGRTAIRGLNSVSPSGVTPFRAEESLLTGNTLIYGATRTGKTSMLVALISSLVRQNRSVCLIDPHGDLSVKALAACPDNFDISRILYVDPARSPVGLNPFEILRMHGSAVKMSSLISECIGHVVKIAFGHIYWGPRMEYLLKGMLKPLSETEGTNFADIMELMNNPFATRMLLETVKDESSRNFLSAEMSKTKDDWWMSIKDKIGRIILDECTRKILCRRRGNVDMAHLLADGKSLFADVDMNTVGRENSVLIGSIIMSMFWVVASAMKTGATIVVDEAQLYPPEIIQEIASQGRKFNVNIIFASQSPSYFSREFLGAAGSNFSNRIVMRLGGTDAQIAQTLIGGVEADEITALQPMHALANISGEVSLISVDPACENDELRDRVIDMTVEAYPPADDALPSPFASTEGQLFDVLQIVHMAEIRGTRSLITLQEEGALQMFPYRVNELYAVLNTAKSMGLVQKSRLSLTQSGRREFKRLQGGMFAGNEEHRDGVIGSKEALETMGLLTYIPRQRFGEERPDLLAKLAGGIVSMLFYFEMEVTTKYHLVERRKKVARAEKDGAIPVFVFTEEEPVLSALKKGEFPTSLFLHLKDGHLRAFSGSGWVQLAKAKDIVEMATALGTRVREKTS